MSEVNPIMVQTLAKMTGKTEEEVLKFLEKKDVEQLQVVSDLSKTQTLNAPKVELPKELQNKTVPLPVETPDAKVNEVAKVLAPVEEVITEEVPIEDLTQEQLEEVDENQFASTSIRVGSKVRCTWQPNAGKGKIKWVGKTGTVVQKLSDSGVSIYLVEFPAGKIPFSRLNKKTGKLERGYSIKKLQQWMDENNIEEVF